MAQYAPASVVDESKLLAVFFKNYGCDRTIPDVDFTIRDMRHEFYLILPESAQNWRSQYILTVR